MEWWKRQFRSFGSLIQWWNSRLTAVGKSIVVLLVVCLPVATNLDTPLFFLWTTLLSLLGVSWVVGWIYRPLLETRVSVPECIVRNREFQIVVQLTNRRRIAAFDLRVEMEPSNSLVEVQKQSVQLSALRPLGRHQISFKLRADRRGQFSVPRIRVSTSFPFGVWSVGQSPLVPVELNVGPAYQPLHGASSILVGSVGKGDQPSQMALAGGDWDYSGSREYTPGMPVRRWDYSSWARLGRPVVREFTNPDKPTAAIILDNYFPSLTRVDIDRFETLVSHVAALADLLLAEGFSLSFVSGGRHIFMPTPSVHNNPLPDIIRFLASPQPDAVDLLADQVPAIERGADPGIIFLVTDRWDDSCKQLTRQLENRSIEWSRSSPMEFAQ